MEYVSRLWEEPELFEWNLISDLRFFTTVTRDFGDIEGSAPSCG